MGTRVRIERGEFMFLRQVQSKGKSYLYLCSYYAENEIQDKRIIYRFGRTEQALINMIAWLENFGHFPKELIELGCSYNDLREWVKSLTTGVSKTGRKIKKVI